MNTLRKQAVLLRTTSRHDSDPRESVIFNPSLHSSPKDDMTLKKAKQHNALNHTETVLRQLATALETSSTQAAQWARQLDNNRRGHPSRIIGSDKAQKILEVLERRGWTLEHFVNRQLPLLNLPKDLRDAIRSGWIAPRHASVLKRVRSERQREEIITELRLRKPFERVNLELVRDSVRAARAGEALGTISRRSTARSSSEASAEDADVRALLAQLEAHFGSRVTLHGFALTIHAETLEGLNGVIDRLDLREY
jgi:hypothetical protein